MSKLHVFMAALAVVFPFLVLANMFGCWVGGHDLTTRHMDRKILMEKIHEFSEMSDKKCRTAASKVYTEMRVRWAAMRAAHHLDTDKIWQGSSVSAMDSHIESLETTFKMLAALCKEN